MAKTRSKTSRKPSPSSTRSPRSSAARELADPEKIGRAQEARARASLRDRKSAVSMATGGDDSSDFERRVASLIDALPDPDFAQRAQDMQAERERIEFVRGRSLTPAEEARLYVGSPGDIGPELSGARRRFAAAQRAEHVYKTPEDAMYVPSGPEAYGARGSVDIARYKPEPSELDRRVAEAARLGTEQAPYSEIESAAERIVEDELAKIGDNDRELDKLLDRATRIRAQLAKGRGEPIPTGDLTDVEVAYAIRQLGPERKAVAGRFTAALRGKKDTDEFGEPIAEGIASRYAMQPALSGALISAYKRTLRAKRDFNLRRLAAEAEAEHNVAALSGAKRRFAAMLRQYASIPRKVRKTQIWAAKLREEILRLAVEFGFATPDI